MTCDVSTAFLHADLDEATPLFMWPPKEYYPQGGILWRLKKAMYGLKGAPRAWQENFASTLQSLGFTRLRSDANVYVQFRFMIVILAYVDDLMLLGKHDDIKNMYEQLAKQFIMKVTGRLDNDGDEVKFLGRILRRCIDAVYFTMPDGYFDEAFNMFKLGKGSTNFAKTPGSKTEKSTANDDLLNAADHRLYRRFVGKLQWVCPIRSDITYAVKELARWLTAPTTRNWNQLKHLMRYLKGTLHYKSFIKPIEKLANTAACLLYTSPSPRDATLSRMPSSA